MDCDDKLDCTTDKCAGPGSCSNIPEDGTCRVIYKTGTDDGGVPITEPRCVKQGTRKPDDPCLACAPTTSDAGASNNTKWMPVSGGTCDDKNKCTKNDTCLNGTCKGSSFLSLCSDGFACTLDLCDGSGGCLGNVLKQGWCLINGTCYLKGGKKPDGTCYECDPAKSVSAWTGTAGLCKIDGACHQKAATHPKGCGTCDPTKSVTAWTPSAGKCVISQKCETSGTTHNTGCGTCDPTKSSTSWTVSSGNSCIVGPSKCVAKATMAGAWPVTPAATSTSLATFTTRWISVAATSRRPARISS